MRASFSIQPAFAAGSLAAGLLMALGVCACAGSAGSGSTARLEQLAGRSAPLGPASLGAALPAPRSLPESHTQPAAHSQPEGRSVSSAQISLTGDGFDILIPSNLVIDGAFGVGIYRPVYVKGGPLSNAAYAVYSFPVAGYSGPGELHIGWTAPPAPDTTWIGLANYSTNRWDWHANPVSSVLPFDFASGDYTSPGGFVHAAVLTATSGEFGLASISLGSNTLPVLNFARSFELVNPGDVDTLDISPSYDPDGTIVKYEFDPEGDGTFVDKGGVSKITHKYMTSGEYFPSARITDNDGASVSWQHTAYVSWQTSIIGSAGENSTSAALYDRTLDCMYFAGTLQGLGQGDEEAFIGKYDLSGQVLWEDTFGTAGKDEFYGLAQDSSNNIYAAGLVGYDGENGNGVLVKISSSGTLIWAKQWSGQFGYTPRCRVDSQDHLYFSGNLYNGPGNPNSFYLAQLDTDGSINWQKTCLCGTDSDLFDCNLDDTDNTYMAGRVSGLSGDPVSGLLVSFAPAGTLRFAKSLDTGKDETLKSVCYAGTLLYLGGSRYLNPNDDSLLAAATKQGVLSWAESYSTGALEEGLSGGGVALQSGGCLLGGSAKDGSGSYDAVLLQVNPNGSLALQKAFGASGKLDGGLCVAAGFVGDYYIGGTLTQQTGAVFTNLNGTRTPLTASLTNIASPTVANGALTLANSAAVFAPLSGETRATGGAMLTQFYPHPST